ncbi:MAG: helix-turn-helix transcriptional regulator, partial [Kofleriaceae bacterium]
MTKAELAERIERSAAAIGQFEGGGRATCRPDAKTLASLALALGVPVAFFTRKTPAKPLEVDGCHFRSLRSASQRERR